MNADSVLAFLRNKAQASKRWVVSFSGGADSLLLLTLCAEVVRESPHLTLTAWYLNHYGTPIEDARSAVFDWVTATLTPLLGERFVFLKESAPIDEIAKRLGYSWEHTASLVRRKRLASLKSALPHCLVFTGHNLSDYYETLAMRRARKIPESAWPALTREDTTELVLRPLAHLDRDTVRRLLKERGIDWFEDLSNQETRFERNRVRLQIAASEIIPPEAIAKTDQAMPFTCESGRELRVNQETWASLSEISRQNLIYSAWKKMLIAGRFTANDFERARTLPFSAPPLFVHREENRTDKYIVFRRGLGEKGSVVASVDLSRENQNYLRGDRVTRSLTIQKPYGRKSVAKIFSEMRLSSRQRRLTWVFLTEDKKNALKIYFPEGVAP